MTIRVWLFGFLAASPLSAQGTQAIQVREGDLLGPVAHAVDPALRESPALQQCDFRTPVVGYLAGSGIVTYVIRPSGRADTATVKVVAADSVSPEGLRSVAVRLLGRCQFRPARTERGKVPALVQQRLSLRSRGLQKVLLPPESLPALDPLDPSPIAVYDLTAPALEEVPAPIRCSVPYVATGTVTVSLVVGPDGRAERNSADALRAEPAVLTRYASRLAESCRFTPGRVRGEPVRVRLVQTFRLYRG